MRRWLAWLLLALPVFSFSQDKYPSRPVTLVAPFPPGGSVELTGRPLAASLEKAFKQPVVFSNRVGAAGAVGTAYVASSEPDGYRLLIRSEEHTSELQSQSNLVCRLLLEKKKKLKFHTLGYDDGTRAPTQAPGLCAVAFCIP